MRRRSASSKKAIAVTGRVRWLRAGTESRGRRLTQWRRAYRKGLLDGGRTVFTPVEIGPDPDRRQLEAPAPQGVGIDDRVEITLANGRRLSVGSSIDATNLTRLVQVLERA